MPASRREAAVRQFGLIKMRVNPHLGLSGTSRVVVEEIVIAFKIKLVFDILR